MTIQFPVHTEAFAGVEFRALRNAGLSLDVYALYGRPSEASSLLKRWSVSSIPVSWFTPKTLLRFFVYFCSHPIHIIDCVVWLVVHAWNQPSLLIKCLILLPRIFEIYDSIQKSPPQVLHVYWGHYPSVLGYLVKKWGPERTSLSMFLGAYDMLYRFGPSIPVANLADTFWTHAPTNVDMLRAMGITNTIFVLPRGIDLLQVPRQAKRDPYRIVTVARLVPEKGVGLLLEAIRLVRKRFPQVRLAVIGDGPIRDELEANAEASGLGAAVEFLGSMPHDEVYRQLSISGIFALVSTNPSERLPNSLKEALACGCVCIVTETPDVMQLLGELEYPLIIKPDAVDLAEKIAAVFEQPKKFDRDRERGVRVVVSSFFSAAAAMVRVDAWCGTKAPECRSPATRPS